MKDASSEHELLNERRWEPGWDEHESLQRQRMASLSLSEKILWLEEAQRVAAHLQSSRSSAAAQSVSDRE